jgi:hypothetical protein
MYIAFRHNAIAYLIDCIIIIIIIIIIVVVVVVVVVVGVVVVIVVVVVIAVQPFVGPWTLFQFLNPIHNW